MTSPEKLAEAFTRGSRLLHPEQVEVIRSAMREMFAVVQKEAIEELGRDKARLDWLEDTYHRPEFLLSLSQDVRATIDAAMKEAK